MSINLYGGVGLNLNSGALFSNTILEKKNINYPYNVSEVTPINRDVVNYNSTGNSDNTINNINNEKIIKLHGLFTQVGMLSSNNSLFFTGYKLTV